LTHFLEEDLLVPALVLLREHPEGLTMTQLIAELTRVMRPTGADRLPTGGRADSRFSQEVRNLRSHKTLERGGRVTRPVPRGKYQITAAGLAFLDDVEPLDSGLRAQGTERGALKREYERDYADVVVEEGVLTTRKSVHRTRSRLLRRAAIRAFRLRNGGRLFCGACGFDFEAEYGVLGRDYIEMHHTTPLHTTDASRTRVAGALADGRLVPLCANCHRMAHKKRSGVYSVAQLQTARTTKALP
jgi:hypothetical protein